MKRFLFCLLLATTVTAAERIVIVSASDASVTYRELMPERVAADFDGGVYHFKGCPAIAPRMPWLATAAATLRGLRPHCPSLRKTEYATRTEARAPRDGNAIAVLFLGNSLTYFNQIPAMTAAIGAREKRPLRVDSETRSGVTLEQLWRDTGALKKLWTQHWDYVVLQGGAGAANPLHNANDFNTYLERFGNEVRRSGATPLFYLVWRPDVGAKEFERASIDAARRMRMRVVPAGIAWLEVSARRRLDCDGLHPNAFGAYLVACTVYSTIYGKPAHQAPFDFRGLATHETSDKALREQTITAEDARMIQDAAWRAVSSAPGSGRS
jgi:hypothetical protein